MDRAAIAGVRRACRRFVLPAALLLSAAATLDGARWSEIGSGLPRTMAVTSLAIDSATPSTFYAVDNQGWLFKTIDSAGSWNLLSAPAGVRGVAVDPGDSSILYAATSSGVFKSTDGGESWTGANSGFTPEFVATNVWMIAIDPLTPATLYADTISGMFKSMDAAQSWNKLQGFPPEYTINYSPDYYYSGGPVIAPTMPSTVYYEIPEGNAILKSTDGGQSWNRLDMPAGRGITRGLVIDPLTGSTLYAPSYARSPQAGGSVLTSMDGSILKSTNGGQTWTVHAAAPPGASVTSLAIDPLSPSTVYAAWWSSGDITWGISKSTDSGENWSTLNTGLPALANANPIGGATFLVAVSPTTPATVYTVYSLPPAGGHLAKSTDGGGTWNAADAGLGYIDVYALAIDPLTPSVMYAGMGGGAASSIPLFQSVDGGTSWTSFAQFDGTQFGATSYGWINSVLPGSADPNLLYASTTAGPANDYGGWGVLFRTRDGGASWSRADLSTQSPTVMASDPADPNTVYLGDFLPWDDGEAILYKSVDGGSTWTNVYQWDIGPLNALVADPANPGTFYAGTPEGVFKSADGGASWSNLGLSVGVTSLAVDPGDSNTIYAAAASYAYANVAFQGVFKSTDGGATWMPINEGLIFGVPAASLDFFPATSIALAPGDTTTVYLATSGRGVYKSLNGGANWELRNKGLTNLDVRLLKVTSNVLYAVTTSGIFRAID